MLMFFVGFLVSVRMAAVFLQILQYECRSCIDEVASLVAKKVGKVVAQKPKPTLLKKESKATKTSNDQPAESSRLLLGR